jgi:hypothetical protein
MPSICIVGKRLSGKTTRANELNFEHGNFLRIVEDSEVLLNTTDVVKNIVEDGDVIVIAQDLSQIRSYIHLFDDVIEM